VRSVGRFLRRLGSQRRLLIVAVAAFLTMAVAIAASVNASHSSDEVSSTVDTAVGSESLDDPTDPTGPVSDTCFGRVLWLVRQIPQALRDGYGSGLSDNSLSTEYGFDSREYRTFGYAQAQIVGDVAMHGHPEEQVLKAVPTIHQMCGD
jgi:hypothetical protein